MADDLSFWVMVRDVEDFLTVDEAAVLIAAEITQNLDPFGGMGADHPFFAELPLHVRAVLVKLAVAGSGSADKAQVARGVGQLLGIEKARGGDATDALAVAVCHAHSSHLAAHIRKHA